VDRIISKGLLLLLIKFIESMIIISYFS
jgi:hypothetical protein